MDSPSQRPAGAASILSFPRSPREDRAQPGEGKDRQFLDMVLNSMSQGLVLFSADTQLVFCNKSYIEMYGLSPERVKPGCKLRDLLEYRAAVGTFSGDLDQYIQGILDRTAGGKTSRNVVESGDGRVFSIINKPLPGGGWLATHEDITE